MAKATSFAEKAAKATMERGVKCPKCHTVLTPILLVTSERSTHSSGWRFSHRRAQVCKCNEKQVYG